VKQGFPIDLLNVSEEYNRDLISAKSSNLYPAAVTHAGKEYSIG
jgi:hypothetical protein